MHFIEECKNYEQQRKIIKDKLRRQTLLQLTLTDCCLSSHTYEKKLKEMSRPRQII